MNALQVRRLGDQFYDARLYLDGKRVTHKVWNAAHLGRSIDSLATRITTRKSDGAEMVREYHCIRVQP